jgi:hypothetical protein
VKDSITAAAGGGQANATLIISQINRITTVVTAADSVKLPPASAQGAVPSGTEVTITNAAAANSANVYPATGDQINALGVNAAFALAAGKTASFTAFSGQWHAMLSA